MSNNLWQTYFDKTKDAKPRSLLVEAVPLVKIRDQALDLGSGAFNDVRYLLSPDINFKQVTAVDKEPLAESIVEHFPADRLNYIISSFETFDFPQDKYDLVNAQYALPFITRDSFSKVFNSIIATLKLGGVFVGQLFGDRDEWNTSDSKLVFHTKEQAEKLFTGLKVVKLVEEKKAGPTAMGRVKLWHVFHFIVIK